MARACFCGCGRKISREHKANDKKAREILFLGRAVEDQAVPFQDAYVLLLERQENADPDELREAREGATAVRELPDLSRQICEQVARSIHEDDSSQVLTENLETFKRRLSAQDAKVREGCSAVGLKYDELAELGPEGIVRIVEEKDRRDRERLGLPER